jgi:phage head maturation protease
VTGSSFSFIPHPEKGVVNVKEGNIYVRELHSVQLFDVGPVTFPAYQGSTTGVRALGDPQKAGRATSRSLRTRRAPGTVNAIVWATCFR